MASLAVMGQGLTQLPACVFTEENKEGSLRSRKSHFMKLCNALGPSTQWITECSSIQEESFSFLTFKEDADRHYRGYSALYFPQK